MTTDDTSLAEAMAAIRNDQGLLMALSLNNLSHENDYHEIGGYIVNEFVRNSYGTESNEGRLADAYRVLAHEEPALYGMTFHNLLMNLAGENVDVGVEYPSSAARELVGKVIADNPELAAAVTALEPLIPF